MKTAATLLVLLLTHTSPSDWTPPKHPDPVRILREAKFDVSAKRYEDALAKLVWFHENALKYDRGLAAVRLSYALSYWRDLGRAYPPAMTKLKAFRDQALDNVTKRNDVQAAFREFDAINAYLGEDARTKAVFVSLDAQDPAVAKEVFEIAQAALIKAKEYKLCGKYLEAEQAFSRATENFRDFRQRGSDEDNPLVRGSLRRFAEQTFSNESATLVALLVVNGRRSDAQRIADEAKKDWDDTSLHAALEKALDGQVPDPWPDRSR
jgi:tetratricopeptide (TPR) repeat protein